MFTRLKDSRNRNIVYGLTSFKNNRWSPDPSTALPGLATFIYGSKSSWTRRHDLQCIPAPLQHAELSVSQIFSTRHWIIARIFRVLASSWTTHCKIAHGIQIKCTQLCFRDAQLTPQKLTIVTWLKDRSARWMKNAFARGSKPPFDTKQKQKQKPRLDASGCNLVVLSKASSWCRLWRLTGLKCR